MPVTRAASAPEPVQVDELLRRGLSDLGQTLEAEQLRRLQGYLTLLARWNKTFNLTAVRTTTAMITRHLLDSLSVLPHLRGQTIIDVGSGAGLPGMVLAISDPTRHYTLLDSNGKKTRFMFQASAELGISNCSVVHERVELWRSDECFDAVISRAFASLGDMIDTCGHLLAESGVFLAMKGQVPQEELAAVASRATVEAVTELEVPGLNEARCLVTLRPLAA